MSQCASNPYLFVKASQVSKAESTRLNLCLQDFVEIIKYEHGRTMPCCNLVQIPEESLQGRYRFLGIEPEVNVVDVFAQLTEKKMWRTIQTIHAYVRVSSSSRLAISRATEVFPTPVLPVKRIADTTVLC